ncbi:MAG: hypothetical protein ACI4DO_10785 [Roseburia sp.]
MKVKTYRICLVAVLVLVIVSGVVYYITTASQAKERDDAATFVERVIPEGVWS